MYILQFREFYEIYARIKRLTTCANIFESVSNIANIIFIVVSHNATNEVQKMFRTTRIVHP